MNGTKWLFGPSTILRKCSVWNFENLTEFPFGISNFLMKF